MPESGKSKAKATFARVATHRRNLRRNGMKRVEVRVAATDAECVRQLARILRQGGADADWLRDRLAARRDPHTVTTGGELLAFFRASPLVGADVFIERDKEPARPIDLQ